MSKLRLKKMDHLEDIRSNVQVNESESKENFFKNNPLKDEQETVHHKEKISKYFKHNTDIEHLNDLNESDDFVHGRISKKVIQNVQQKKCNKKKKSVSKNQQDIRTMKKFHSNLEDYTENFKEVCTQGGVDVDPDQLQMAIALSQSLQEYEGTSNVDEKEKVEEDESIDKITRIKKTLEQFGFTVKSSVSLENTISYKRRYKRCKKTDFPLIKKENEEKKQIVADKISEILLESNVIDTKFSNSKYICTNEMISEIVCEKMCCLSKNSLNYKEIEDEILYYVPNLIVPSSNKVGCLLKDWSNIPGREKSPTRTIENYDIKNDILFANHLDLLLSGTVKKIQCIQDNISISMSQKNIDEDNNVSNEKIARCYSPDLFEDTLYDNENNERMDNKSDSESQNKQMNKSESFKNESIILIEDEGLTGENGIQVSLKEGLSNNNLSGSSGSNSNLNEIIYKPNNVVLVDDEVLTAESGIGVSLKESLTNDSLHRSSSSFKDFDETIPKPKVIIEDEVLTAESGTRTSLNKYLSNYSLNSVNEESNKQDMEQSNFYSGYEHEISINDNGIVYFESYHNLSVNTITPLSSESNSDNLNNDKQNDVEEIDLTQSSDDKSKDHSNEDRLNDDCSQIVGNSDSSDNELIYEDSVPHLQWKTSPKFKEFLTQTEVVSARDHSINSLHDKDLDESKNYSFEPIPYGEKRDNRQHSKLYRSSILDPITSYDVIDLDNATINRSDMMEKNQSESNKKCAMKRKIDECEESVLSDSLPDVHLDGINKELCDLSKNVIDLLEASVNGTISMETEFIIKTRNVTPIPDYDSMEDSAIEKELLKYGIRPLKKKRAVQILKHLYEQTHPLVEVNKIPLLRNQIKKRKLDLDDTDQFKCSFANENNLNSSNCEEERVNILKENIPNTSADTLNRIVTGKAVDCKPEEWIFQSREQKKVYGCRVPLHIAFHNFLSVRPLLREAILKYEPVDAESIHRGLIEIGFRYKIKDVMEFLDKKCISIKTKKKDERKQ